MKLKGLIQTALILGGYISIFWTIWGAVPLTVGLGWILAELLIDLRRPI